MMYIGSYLASGGQDGKIIIWRVFDRCTDNTTIPVIHSNNNSNMNNDNNKTAHVRASSSNSTQPEDEDQVFQLLSRTPYHIFQGHTGEVVEVAWSRSHFLLSASIDKTVRLWHVSR